LNLNGAYMQLPLTNRSTRHCLKGLTLRWVKTNCERHNNININLKT